MEEMVGNSSAPFVGILGAFRFIGEPMRCHKFELLPLYRLGIVNAPPGGFQRLNYCFVGILYYILTVSGRIRAGTGHRARAKRSKAALPTFILKEKGQ